MWFLLPLVLLRHPIRSLPVTRRRDRNCQERGGRRSCLNSRNARDVKIHCINASNSSLAHLVRPRYRQICIRNTFGLCQAGVQSEQQNIMPHTTNFAHTCLFLRKDTLVQETHVMDILEIHVQITDTHLLLSSAVKTEEKEKENSIATRKHYRNNLFFFGSRLFFILLQINFICRDLRASHKNRLTCFCERRVNLLVYSLSLHRHSYIGFILAFASSIHNKQLCFPVFQ